MKKTISIIIILTLLLAVFSGCTKAKGEPAQEGLKIIAANFPAYDFAGQITGEDARVTMLLPPGTESHSYEPSAQDIIKIQSCDLFIYTGGANDSWIEKILSSLEHEVETFTMMDYVDVVEEELKEGMQADHDHLHEDEHPEDHHELNEYDQHVWTSPKNAMLITAALAEKISAIDPDGSSAYAENAQTYLAELQELHNSFEEFFDTAKTKTLIFGDRFPFRYFVEEYGLDYYAAFPGCNSESETSAATVAFLIDKVNEEELGAVFYIELSNHLVADSIAEATGAKTAMLHSCHNVSQAEFDGGATYITLMEQNLETLKGAIG